MTTGETVELRDPDTLEAALAALDDIQGGSRNGPYPLLTAALDAIHSGDLDSFFVYAGAASSLTILRHKEIDTAVASVRRAFALPSH